MSAEENIEELSGIELATQPPVGIEFFDHRHRRTTKLINNESPEGYIKGQNRAYSFTFKQPFM